MLIILSASFNLHAQHSAEASELAKTIPIADAHMHTYSRGGPSSSAFLEQMDKNNVRWGGAVGDYRADVADKLKERYIPAIGQIEFMEVFFSRGASALTDEENRTFKRLYKNAEEQFANGTIKGFGELHTDNHSSGPQSIRRTIRTDNPAIRKMYSIADKYNGFVQIHSQQDENFTADILYKLSGQVVARLRSYLSSEEEVLNVIQFNQRQFATYIHSQMQDHWWQEADDGYEVIVSRGYQTFTDTSYSADGNEKLRNVHVPLATGERDRISGMLFGGFERCSYPVQKFSSDSERIFASMLEKDLDAKKWFKPTRDQFSISYRDTSGSTATYEPDFVVETATHKYIVEPKQASLMNDANVLAKKVAAVTWCQNATEHELKNGGKAWAYVLVPHTAILPSATLIGLIQQFGGV